MKISYINKIFSFFSVLSLLLFWGCEKNITEFGFDGVISGTIKTADGSIVAGDMTNNTLIVQALGEGDLVTTVIRVDGDGTYQNTKLFPAKTKIWLTGPVITEGSDTIEIDFTTRKEQVYDFTVIPFLSIKTPVLNGTPTSATITVDYDIKGNAGYTSKTRNIYCGTYRYPNNSIGSGTFYTTKIVPVNTDSGTATITGLVSGTKYYIRVGATANGSNYQNFSEQIIVTTP